MTNQRLDHEGGTTGPHGGPVVRTATRTMEVSVFETGVSPRFRLYFSGSPGPLPRIEEVSAETVRPDGARQAFAFENRGDFIESTSEIPEPHEFDVLLTLRGSGGTERVRCRFTEADHARGPHDPGRGAHDHALGHDHGEHDHGHGYAGHDHGTGPLAWLRRTFGHSHDIADKVDDAMATHERGIWALKWSLIGLGATALLQVVIVAVSGSAALLADTIHNFADAATSLPLWVAFALARRGASRRFTYGLGKVEDVAGVAIVMIILGSACFAGYESILKIIHPQPMSHLGLVAAAAIIGFVGNEAVAVFRIRVGRQIGSAALVADGQHARVDGFTSLAVLIGVAGAWFGAPILDPIVGLGITVAILFIVKNAAVSVGLRLIDGIEPDVLERIEHAASHVGEVRSVQRVRARWIGHRIHAELDIEVDPGLSLQRADDAAKSVERAVKEHVKMLGEVVVRVRSAMR